MLMEILTSKLADTCRRGDLVTEFLITNKMIILVGSLIFVDVFTGIIKATKRHSLKSAILRNGGYKKFLIILILVLAWSIDKIYFNSDILYTICCTYYIANEALSITENLALMGIPIPQKVKAILAELKEKE